MVNKNYFLKPDAAETEKSTRPVMGFTRGESSSMLLAVVLLFYAVNQSDIPAAFLTLSFLLFELRVPAEIFGGRYGNSLAGLLRGLSVTLFLGALFLAFL